jgi:HEXXH motif-containing protein
VSDNSQAIVPPKHCLPIAQLDSLAAGGFDRDAVATLCEGERSRRMLLFWTVVKRARDRPGSTGPLPSVDTAWNLLLRAESAAPSIVEEILAQPQTGVWVAHTLRRLRGVGSDPTPLWFHVGQLHTLAVAAAIGAGLRCDMAVPVWRGDIVFPSLGCLRLPVDDECGYAEVNVGTTIRIRCADTTTELDLRSDVHTPRWFPLRSLRSCTDGLDIRLRLDDLTAYRGLDNPVRPAPLDATEVVRWQALLDGAWTILTRDHQDWAHELAAGMTPLPAGFRFRPHSSSVEDGFGAAILSEPYDAAQLAVTLVHEFQHSVLNGLRHLTPLVTDDDPVLGYAPWRDDPRPLGALLHGVFAFTAVAEFWETHRHRLDGPDVEVADFEFALWRHQSGTVLRSIRDQHRALTKAGTRFLDRIAERLARLDAKPVPHRAIIAAESAAADHAACWRTCHLRPDPDLVSAMADAWVAGRAAPSVADDRRPLVEPGRPTQRFDARAVLMRVRMADPGLFTRLHTEPHLVAGASQADVSYVAGDVSTALRHYLVELSGVPDRLAAWSGLGLVLAAAGQDKTSKFLLQQPELVRAVAAAVTADTGRQPPPDELATWLADGQE